MAAISNLASKFDALSASVATKEDVAKAAFESSHRLSEFAAHTESQFASFSAKLQEVNASFEKLIKRSTGPLTSKVSDLAKDVAKALQLNKDLREDFEKLRSSSLSGSAAASAGPSSGLPSTVQQLLNNLDPAVRRVACLGFDDSTSEEQRITLVKDFVKKEAPQHNLADVACFKKGPHNNRSLTSVAYAEFANADAAKNFAKKFADAKAKLSSSVVVSVRMARSKVNGQRNFALRQASDVLKKHCGGKEVSVAWKNREVTVGGECAFKQDRAELSGSFVGVFSPLRLE